MTPGYVEPAPEQKLRNMRAWSDEQERGCAGVKGGNEFRRVRNKPLHRKNGGTDDDGDLRHSSRKRCAQLREECTFGTRLLRRMLRVAARRTRRRRIRQMRERMRERDLLAEHQQSDQGCAQQTTAAAKTWAHARAIRKNVRKDGDKKVTGCTNDHQIIRPPRRVCEAFADSRRTSRPRRWHPPTRVRRTTV